MQIFEYDQNRLCARFGAQEVEPSATQLFGHDGRIATSDPKKVAAVIRKWRANDLTKKIANAPPLTGFDMRAHAAFELALSLGQWFVASNAARSSNDLSQHTERRAGGQGIQTRRGFARGGASIGSRC